MLWVISVWALPVGPTATFDDVAFELKDEDRFLPTAPSTDVPVAEVVGGEQVTPGTYNDAVGIVFTVPGQGSFVGCTGTLVAPDVVLTAAHCVEDGFVTAVLIGSTDWAGPEGEAILVEDQWMHPSYVPFTVYQGADLAVLKLEADSTYTPRQVAFGCALDDIEDDAPATIVGFGNTRANGTGSTTRKNVGFTLVRDADCSQDRLAGIETGCIPELRPGGEISAGGWIDVDGDGNQDPIVDACFGDSGGPLYVGTPFGEMLVGVTSRAFLGVQPDRPCRDGGVWVRPDSFLNFIESRTGVTLDPPTCNIPPTGDIERKVVPAGRSLSFDLEIDDPDSDSFTVVLMETDPNISVEIDGTRIRFDADRDAEGEQGTIRFEVTDEGGSRAGSLPETGIVEVPYVVTERGCGCSSQGFVAGWMALLPLWLLRRRRAL